MPGLKEKTAVRERLAVRRAAARQRMAERREKMADAVRRQREKRQTRELQRRVREAESPTLRVKIRRMRRLAGLVFCTFFAFGLWMCCWPVQLVAPRRMRPIRRSLVKLWGRMCLWTLNMKLKTYGRPPKPGYFMVLNHVGYVDIFVMAAQTGAVFVAKAEMDTWPIFGWMMRNTHQIFIERNNFRDAKRVLDLLGGVLDEDDALIVFAEGRCSPGAEVMPFRPSLFQIAAERRYPVHYASITFETPEGDPAPSDSIAWWRWEPLMDHMTRLLSLNSSKATVYFSRDPVVSGCRKELARETYAGCVELFAPLRQGVLPELPTPDDAPKLYREKRQSCVAPDESGS